MLPLFKNLCLKKRQLMQVQWIKTATGLLNRQKSRKRFQKETKVKNKEENVPEKPAEIAPKTVQRAIASNQVAPVYASKESGLRELDLPPLNMAPPNRNFVFHKLRFPKTTTSISTISRHVWAIAPSALETATTELTASLNSRDT